MREKRSKTKRDASPAAPIAIVDSEEYWRIQDDFQARRGPAKKDGHDTWDQFDTALLKVFRKYGKVGLDLDADFYESGNWFHELLHAFEVHNPKFLTAELLRRLQQVVAKHHQDAMVLIEGGFESDLFGLRIAITASAIYVACDEENPRQCRQSLRRFGIQIPQYIK